MPAPMHLPADPELAALRDALAARHLPADAVERHWVEELAFAAWRQRHLRTLDAAALTAPFDTPKPAPRLDRGEPDDAAPRPPSLAVLARYRARIERDHRLALAEVERLQALRPDRQRHAPAGLAPAQLRWLADHIEGQTGQAPVADTNEPEIGTNEPNHRPAADPRPAAAAPAPAVPVAGTNEPDRAALALNRQQRRRLAALDRQPFRRAA